MLNALRRRIPIPWLIAGSLCAALAVALYCMAYTALLGRGETFRQALGWALANVSPWLFAIEFAKRAREWLGAMAFLAAALGASLLIGFATGADDGGTSPSWAPAPTSSGSPSGPRSPAARSSAPSPRWIPATRCG